MSHKCLLCLGVYYCLSAVVNNDTRGCMYFDEFKRDCDDTIAKLKEINSTVPLSEDKIKKERIYMKEQETVVNKHNDDTIQDLPTSDEYRQIAEQYVFRKIWSEPKYKCPRCGGVMRRNEMLRYPTCPEQFEYKCDQCAYTENQFM